MRFPFKLIILFALTLAGCTTPSIDSSPSQAYYQSKIYPDLGEAPELTNEIWLNTTGPIRLAELRGKVVLIDMWTFG
ncbi:MAG: hypothetical protein ABIJ65_03055 [Chloroflexota bacterium]